MNKEHLYKNFRFNIKVELNHTNEITIGGKHKITINDMGVTNYYKVVNCQTRNLIKTIDELIEQAERWVDERLDENKSYEVKLLENIGFKQ